MVNNRCEVTCTNGATNPPACNTCPTGASMSNGACACLGGQTIASQCTACPSGQIMDQGSCREGCSVTNVCGQVINGTMSNGTCTAGSGENINNRCITTFNVSADNINPNGFVDFSWKMADLPGGVGSRCGFVDLTTPTPRPIPGLQNLDPTRDSARISNVQTTTRFCLVCQFYSLLNSNVLGDAVQHQWVRVIRIGEQ